jgi:AraC-like DNA-binding protein
MDTPPEYDFSSLPLVKHASRYSSRKFPLHALTILSGHCVEKSTAYYNDGLANDFSAHVAWQYTLAGRGCLELKEKRHELLPGSMMIISIPGPHRYYLPEDSPFWEFVFVTMAGREAIRITRMIEHRLGNMVEIGGMGETRRLLYTLLEKLFSAEINNPFTNSSHTYQLCMKLLEEAGGVREAAGYRAFEGLNTFLKGNLYRDISVDEMAEIMDMSRSHFTRVFGKAMGMSPRMYLEDLRLKTAMDILFEKNATIKETAARCGIYDVNYFCRLFKKRYGISPGKYRECNYPPAIPN